VAVIFEDCDETLGSMKGGGFLDQMCYYKLLNRAVVHRISYLVILV
jgi:hypothetical protein